MPRPAPYSCSRHVTHHVTTVLLIVCYPAVFVLHTRLTSVVASSASRTSQLLRLSPSTLLRSTCVSATSSLTPENLPANLCKDAANSKKKCDVQMLFWPKIALNMFSDMEKHLKPATCTLHGCSFESHQFKPQVHDLQFSVLNSQLIYHCSKA